MAWRKRAIRRLFSTSRAKLQPGAPAVKRVRFDRLGFDKRKAAELTGEASIESLLKEKQRVAEKKNPCQPCASSLASGPFGAIPRNSRRYGAFQPGLFCLCHDALGCHSKLGPVSRQVVADIPSRWYYFNAPRIKRRITTQERLIRTNRRRVDGILTQALNRSSSFGS